MTPVMEPASLMSEFATCVGVHSIGVLLQWMDAKPQFSESPLPP